MSNRFDIVFQTSGLLEKFNCTLEDIKTLYCLSCNTMYDKETRARLDKENDPSEAEDFINTMFLMTGNIEDIRATYERAVKQNEEYFFDIEVKKAAGTFDEWFKEISEKTNKDWPIICEFFKAFDQRLVNRNQRAN